jgi:hypothetical protein
MRSGPDDGLAVHKHLRPLTPGHDTRVYRRPSSVSRPDSGRYGGGAAVGSAVRSLLDQVSDVSGLREVDGVTAAGHFDRLGSDTFAIARWAGGGIMRSWPATKYRAGLVC